MSERGLLTPEEAAEYLKVRPKTVRNWLRNGTLPGVRLGRLWRVRLQDLEAFVDVHVVGEPPKKS